MRAVIFAICNRKSIDFLAECGILIAMEVLQMIERPMYTDRIMAYVNTPFEKNTHRSAPLRKIHDSENDNRKAERRVQRSGRAHIVLPL